MSYFPKPSINENDMVIVQHNDYAKQSISAGQLVQWKGFLLKAKADILNGAPLSDSLFDPTDDDGELNELNDSIPAIFYDSIISRENGGASSFTAPSDGFFFGLCCHSDASRTMYINGAAASIVDGSGSVYVQIIASFLKQGDIVTGTGMRFCFVKLKR